MLSFTLAVALATPCLDPHVAPTKKHKRRAKVTLPATCAELRPLPAIFADPQPVPPAVQVVTKYEYVGTIIPTPGPVVDRMTDPSSWFPSFGGYFPSGGGIGITRNYSTVSNVNVVYNTSVTNNDNRTTNNSFTDVYNFATTNIDDSTHTAINNTVNNNTTNTYGHAHKAPEIGADGAVAGLTMLGFGLMVLRGRRQRA